MGLRRAGQSVAIAAVKTRTIEPERWQAYLNAQAVHVRTTRAEVHVLDPGRDRFAETWDADVQSITYDASANELRVSGDGFVHIVAEPRSMQAMEGPAGELRALEIVAEDGIRHVITLRVPLALAGGS